jgi:hypothetical protein
MASVGFLSIFLSVNHFYPQIGEMPLQIAGCNYPNILIYLYYISINCFKMK